MSTDEPGQLPGVDLVALAGLVGPLVTPQADPARLAKEVAARVVAELAPLVARLEAAAAHERRSIGPYIPPPPSTMN